MPKVLCLPDFEMATHVASSFLLRYVASRIEPAQLYKGLDTPKVFGLATIPADLIIGVGHGSPRVFTGQDEEVLWDVGQYNPRECEGKIIKLLSCLCGQYLGPDLIANGARAFQGYVEPFVFYADTDYLSAETDGAKAVPVRRAVVRFRPELRRRRAAKGQGAGRTARRSAVRRAVKW